MILCPILLCFLFPTGEAPVFPITPRNHFPNAHKDPMQHNGIHQTTPTAAPFYTRTLYIPDRSAIQRSPPMALAFKLKYIDIFLIPLTPLFKGVSTNNRSNLILTITVGEEREGEQLSVYILFLNNYTFCRFSWSCLFPILPVCSSTFPLSVMTVYSF